MSIKYPTAIYDQDEQRWISDAQVAETTYTAFTSKARKHRVTARLIVRRVKRLNPKTAPPGQDELFSVYRYHAVFTDSTEPMLLAEAHHRDHAIVEQVIADLKSSALKHFPSGSFNANGAWLTCAVMAYNLSRAAGVLAGGKLRKARTATIRATLINIPARTAFSAGTYTLHLPANSRRETAVHDHVRRHPGPTPSGLTPDPSAIPGPNQHHPDTPITGSGDTGCPGPAATRSRSTTGFQDQLAGVAVHLG